MHGFSRSKTSYQYTQHTGGVHIYTKIKLSSKQHTRQKDYKDYPPCYTVHVILGITGIGIIRYGLESYNLRF